MTNIAILTGRIARDPETRETKGGTNVTGITVVTDRPARDKDGKTYKDENGYTAKESEFHRVTCFNGLAKTVGQYCSKGQLVSVQGRIHYTQWEDKDGVTRYGTEILAESALGAPSPFEPEAAVDAIDELERVKDLTDHTTGENPFYS